MQSTKRYLISLALCLLATHLPAQDIAGSWEGNMGNDQFLQLNITQKGDYICGFTWDTVKGDSSSYCRAYFEGHYNRKQDVWLLEGTSFIQNSGGHYLMKLSLSQHYFNGDEILEGLSTVKSILVKILTGGLSDSVYLKKVSPKPRALPEKMIDCFPEEKISADTTTISTIPKKTADSIVTIIPPVITATDSLTIPQQFIKRKNTEESHVAVNVKNITLYVYDNAMVDGDTVSIFYNGKLLLSHQRLSEKPIIIQVALDEEQTRHEITLFAENLGSIPPNTALIVVHAGDKRYELFASASLEENAVLVFYYRPE